MIDITKPFMLYALCSVEYDGRAYSTLEKGRYLIIYKKDGSVIIHGSDLCKARNYQQSGSILSIEKDKLISINKKEKITIDIIEQINYTPLEDWSDSKIEISRTEKELVDKIANNHKLFINIEFAVIEREYRTDSGPVDLVCITPNNEYHIIEVKRNKATINHVTQLRKYVDQMQENDFKSYGYLASPEIGKNAVEFLKKNGFTWLKVDF